MRIRTLVGALVLALAATMAQATTITQLALTAQTGTTATIQWTTDVASSTQLFYGTGGGQFNQTPRNPALVTSHSVTLQGVTNGTTYSYYAVSVDIGNNQAQSAVQQFTVCTQGSGLTNVNGNINNYYEYGLYTFNWVTPAGYSITPTVCGQPLTQTSSGTLDSASSFNQQIADTLQIVPSPSQWRMTVTGVDGSIGSFAITQAITPQGNNLTAPLQAAAVGNLLHVWYDPATMTTYPNIGGGGGSFPGSPTAIDYDLYVDKQSQLESGGLFTAQNGVNEWSDSNCVSFGELAGYGWCSRLNQLLNQTNASFTGLLQGSTTQYTAFSGDNSADCVNRIYAITSPVEFGNAANFLECVTNNLKLDSNTTPSAAHQVSFKAQTAASIAQLALSIQDKYYPSSQVATQSGQSIVTTATTTTMTIANGFPNGQKVTVSGCTTATWLNTAPGGIQITSATPTSVTFTTPTGSTVGTIASDSCTLSPSNPMTLAGTWAQIQPQPFPLLFVGPTVGVGFQVGNVLTISCSLRNQQMTVVSAGTSPGPGLSIDYTVDGSGHVLTATLNTPVAGYYSNQTVLIPAGDGTAAVTVQTIGVIGVPTGVTLVNPGGSGYNTNGTNVVTSAVGQLTNNSLAVTQLGAGCQTAANIAPTCSVGTGTACGQALTLTNTVGPTIMYSSTGGTGSITLQVGPAGPDGFAHVLVAYPIGTDWGGLITFLVDGTPMVDQYTGVSAISEAYASGQFIPANYPTDQTVQLADFKVSGSVSHTFTWTTSGTAGFFWLGLPSSSHYAGVNAPNVFVGGAIPRAGNAQGSCGLTLPLSCTSLYSSYLFNLANQYGKIEGLHAKYIDLVVDPITDFFNTTPNNSLVQNRVGNNASGGDTLHMDESGSNRVANQLATGSKVSPALPLTANFTGGINFNATNGSNSGIFYSSLNNQVNTQGSQITQAMDLFHPVGLGINICDYPLTGVDPKFTPSLFTCYAQFSQNRYTMLPQGTAASLTSFASGSDFWTASVFNNGVTYVNTPGSGYTTTGTLAITGGTCSVQPVLSGQLSGSGISAVLTNSGVCTVAPTGVTATGWGAGSGFSGTFTLATNVVIASQTPGTYTGSGTVTATGGVCGVVPTLSSSLGGGGIVVSIASPGNCTTPPTGVTVSGYTGSGLSVTFSTPSASQLSSFQVSFLPSSSDAALKFVAPTTTYNGAPLSYWFTNGSNAGYKMKMDGQLLTLSGSAMTGPAQWNINTVTGTPMMGASTSPILSAACVGTDSQGRIVLGTCAGASPLTTKGDLYGYSTTNARIPIGTDGFVLTADSTQTLGLKWAAAAGGGTTTNALTLNNSGSGAASGSTFNGSAAITLSYNTIGAAPTASPALTGVPTAPTATVGTNTTQIATTAFVLANAGTGSVTGTGTANLIPKWTSGTVIGNSSITDNGTTVSTTEPVTAPSFNTNGSANGSLSLTATGTPPGAAATNTLLITVPNSVTPYTLTMPGAAPAGNGYSLTSTTGGVASWTLISGGSPAFSALTSGTNTTAAMLVGSGASLAPTGTGTITASAPATTVVTFSATPTFTVPTGASGANRIVLTGNVTSSTIASGTDGQELCLDIAQDATGSRTFVAPTNMHGFFTIGSTASKDNVQCFTYLSATSTWLAQSTGVINE